MAGVHGYGGFSQFHPEPTCLYVEDQGSKTSCNFNVAKSFLFLLPAVINDKRFINDCEEMNIIYMNCGLIDKDDSDLRCNEHYMSNREDKAWTKDLGSHRN